MSADNVCKQLKKIRNELVKLTSAANNIANNGGNTSKLINSVENLTSLMDQFYVVLDTDGNIDCKFGAGKTKCFLGYKPCPNDKNLCVYGGRSMSNEIRKEACHTKHYEGDVLMVPLREAFPGSTKSKHMFPVAYDATKPGLDSPAGVKAYLESQLEPSESITPAFVPRIE